MCAVAARVVHGAAPRAEREAIEALVLRARAALEARDARAERGRVHLDHHVPDEGVLDEI